MSIYCLRYWSLIGLVWLATGCASPGQTPERKPSNEEAVQVEPTLRYFTYKSKGVSAQVVHPQQWAGRKWSENRRFDLLIKLYSANTRATSASGLRHAACFEGSGQSVIEAFFSTDPNRKARFPIGYLKNNEILATSSSDGLMIALAFTASKDDQSRFYYFRMPNCNAGKSPVGPEVAEDTSDEGKGVHLENTNQETIEEMMFKPLNSETKIGQVPVPGFDLEDKDQAPPSLHLPQFRLRADFENADKFDNRLPWRNKGLDLHSEKDSLILALILQKYFYENMANQNPKNPDMNFIAEKNRQRYWCHMPWMQAGPQGRESIHGLTKELDLRPSPTMDLYKNTKAGTDWGVAYYNAAGCKTIHEVFGSAANPKKSADFSKANFGDGTVSVKILFTTADFEAIKGAYTWRANTVYPGETKRHILPMRHIQMDIAIRDSTLKGMRSELNDWAMLTFYYDPDFDYDREYKNLVGRPNPLATIPSLPPELLHMRPMGIQTGFEKPAATVSDSLIFAGSQTNGLGGRLNGPADNPKSSCLSCHGAAGVPNHLMPMVPGPLVNAEWAKLPGRLDFSQQIALAKRNIETWLENGSGK